MITRAPAALYLPRAPVADLTVDDVWRFYLNVLWERDHGGYGASEVAALMSYKSGFGGLLSKTAYYRKAYCEPFLRALHLVFSRSPSPVVLDLCCGTGSQSLAFALLGAKVVAVDYSESQLATFGRRRAVYEKAAGRPLDITVHRRDLVSNDLQEFAGFDAAYSHIGIGRLVKADVLLQRLRNAGRTALVVALKNGNPGFWQGLTGRQPADSSPAEYAEAAQRHGFRILRSAATTGLPRPFWVLGPLGRLPDALLSRFITLGMQCEYHLERNT